MSTSAIYVSLKLSVIISDKAPGSQLHRQRNKDFPTQGMEVRLISDSPMSSSACH